MLAVAGLIKAFTSEAGEVRAVRDVAERVRLGQPLSEGLAQAASQEVSDQLDPESDLHASAAYRREVGGVLVRRALSEAAQRAQPKHAAAR
jgi:CO/xanthine dehydrogenase FAD-binding subunit